MLGATAETESITQTVLDFGLVILDFRSSTDDLTLTLELVR
jgi:hypothetical protein